MNRKILLNPSKFASKRAEQFAERLNDQASKIKTPADLLAEMFKSIKNFFLHLGKPTMKKRKIYDGSPPCSADINDTFTEVYNDTRLMADEQVMIGEAFRQSFNFTTTERTRLRNRVKKISEMVSDYIVTATNTISRCLVLQDSFTDHSKANMSTVGSPANLDVNNGVVTLGIVGNINRNENAEIIDIRTNQPNSMPGNFMVAYKKDSEVSQAQFLEGNASPQEQWDLYFNIDPHTSTKAILDGEPNTWYEHQLINVEEDYKKTGYQGKYPDTKGLGWKWSDGLSIYDGKKNESLEFTIIIKLPEPSIINWIDFHPYFPNESCYLTVNEVATSMKNAGDYDTCLLDPGDRNMKLGSGSNNLPPDVKDRNKFIGHGSWVFNARLAQYIKIKVTADKPYTCNIAHLYWEVEYDVETTTSYLFGLIKSSDTAHYKKRIEGPKFSRDKVIGFTGDVNITGEWAQAGSDAAGFLGGVIAGALGFIVDIFVDQKTEVKNEKMSSGFDIYPDGWRWCVGIRGIGISSYDYATKSTFISKTFNLHKPIKDISLSVSEMVPEEFYANDQKLKNSWIKYYVSVDEGNTWHTISPLERTPVYGEKDFPNKIVSVIQEDSEGQMPGKTYIKTDKEVKTVKFMADFRRPEELNDLTPALYDYKLRIVPGSTGEEEDL